MVLFAKMYWIERNLFVEVILITTLCFVYCQNNSGEYNKTMKDIQQYFSNSPLTGISTEEHFWNVVNILSMGKLSTLSEGFWSNPFLHTILKCIASIHEEQLLRLIDCSKNLLNFCV